MDQNASTMLLVLAFAAAPLAAFEPFVGRWQSDDGTEIRELSWGLDRRMIHIRHMRNGKQTADGAYFWNPLKQQIEGRLVSVDGTITFDAAAATPIAAGLSIDHVGVNSVGERVVHRETWHLVEGRIRVDGRWLQGTGDSPAWRREWTPEASDDMTARN